MNDIPEPGTEISKWFHCKECNKQFLVVGYFDIQEHEGYCDNCEYFKQEEGENNLTREIT